MKSFKNVLLLLLLAVLGCGQQLVEYPLDTAPTVTITNPADTSFGVDSRVKVSAAFSKPMDATTLTSATFILMQEGVPVPATVTYVDMRATLVPTGALTTGAMFTAVITTLAEDDVGNALAAEYLWTFTTSNAPDTTPPTVSVTAPAAGATGAPSGTTVSAAFSEAMAPATISGATFTLMQGAAPVPGAVTYSGLTATLTPVNPLAADAAFTATITTGVEDLSGNALAADFTWSFITAKDPDETPPAITVTGPVNGASQVAVDAPLTAIFDEAMDPATITGLTFTLSQGAIVVAGAVSYAGTTATFTPAFDLSTDSDFTATVTAEVTDLAGNAMAANFVWTFQTGTPPAVIDTNPANAAHGVAIDRKVDATFSVPMDPLTIDALTFSLAQGAMSLAGDVTYVGTTATFTPAADYEQGAVVTATITTGAKDLNGNGLLHDYVWSFQTGAQVGQQAVPLGEAGPFAILAFNTVTNVNNPGTIVTGDLGISPGAALVGFPPGEVNGTTHAGDATAFQAKGDLLLAYNDAAGRLGAAVLPGDVSGLTFTPGLYKNESSLMLSAGNFTLDAQGDVNATFIFQMGSTLTTSSGTQVILSGGAKATNVYWAVGTSATLGTNSIFKGTILAASAITMETGASIEGRLLAQGAAVALDTNAITVPVP